MTSVYMVCLLIGVIVPLLSLICDFFDGISDALGVAIDFPDIELGDFHIALLPISVNSICAVLLAFGASGLILEKVSGFTRVIILIISLLIGYLCGILIQTLIKRLKRVEYPAIKEEELLLFNTHVVNTIPENGIGSISITIPNSSSVSYPARCVDGYRIEQEEEVEISYFEKGIAYVRTKKYLEKKYDKLYEDQKTL